MGTNLHQYDYSVSKTERQEKYGHSAPVLWFTGLSGSGKSTLANAVERKLFDLGLKTYVLDGDNVRSGLNKDLGFTPEGRIENIRRIGEVANLFSDSGTVTLTAFISPYISDRQIARDVIGKDFIEVFVNAPLETCEERDPKGLYEKARAGIIPNFTGIDSPYEEPENPEIMIESDIFSIEECADMIINYIENKYLRNEP